MNVLILISHRNINKDKIYIIGKKQSNPMMKSTIDIVIYIKKNKLFFFK